MEYSIKLIGVNFKNIAAGIGKNVEGKKGRQRQNGDIHSFILKYILPKS